MKRLVRLVRFVLGGPTADEVIKSSLVLLRDIQASASREAAAYDAAANKLLKQSCEAVMEASRADVAAGALEQLLQGKGGNRVHIGRAVG